MTEFSQNEIEYAQEHLSAFKIIECPTCIYIDINERDNYNFENIIDLKIAIFKSDKSKFGFKIFDDRVGCDKAVIYRCNRRFQLIKIVNWIKMILAYILIMDHSNSGDMVRDLKLPVNN